MALAPKRPRYLALSMRASPAVTMRMGAPFREKDRVLAMRQGAQPSA